jgi:hypothetical protein
MPLLSRHEATRRYRRLDPWNGNMPAIRASTAMECNALSRLVAARLS